MAAMTKHNLGLIAARQSKEPFAALASNCVCAHKIVTVYDRSFIFPLYVYIAEKKKDNSSEAISKELFELPAEGHVLRPNLNPTFLKALSDKLNLPQEGQYGLPKGIAPEDIFHYAYAVFQSPTYRRRYAEFLKIDFPRLPLTNAVNLIRDLAAKGVELVALHLLESPKLNDFLTDWPVKGDNVVEKVQYTDKDQRVWINKTQYFGDVPKTVWDFHIGGYQVCERWLKDRKGRTLTYEDTQHYQKIVVALAETIRLMAEIDQVIETHGGWPIK